MAKILTRQSLDEAMFDLVVVSEGIVAFVKQGQNLTNVAPATSARILAGDLVKVLNRCGT